MEEHVNVTANTVTLYPKHWATIDAYAKDMGYPSTSASLRRIIDEWVTLKSKQLSLLTDERPAYAADGQLERGHDLRDEAPRGRL